MQPLLAQGTGDPRLHITGVTQGPGLRGDGITSELGALAERRKLTGLYPLSVGWNAADGSTGAELVAKVKSRGDEIVGGVAKLFSVCGPELDAAWQRWGADTVFTDAHRRELAVYRRGEPVLKDLLPRCYGLLEDEEREAYVILMERLPDDGGPWNAARTDQALRAVGAVHGHWLGRDQQVLAEGWLHHVPDPAQPAKARELWAALVRHAAAELPELLGAHRRDVLLGVVEDAERWTQELHAMPRTLVHNDFNPRNLAVREGRIVAYDWELATVGPPQRDAVELLAFTAGPTAPRIAGSRTGPTGAPPSAATASRSAPLTSFVRSARSAALSCRTAPPTRSRTASTRPGIRAARPGPEATNRTPSSSTNARLPSAAGPTTVSPRPAAGCGGYFVTGRCRAMLVSGAGRTPEQDPTAQRREAAHPYSPAPPRRTGECPRSQHPAALEAQPPRTGEHESPPRPRSGRRA